MPAYYSEFDPKAAAWLRELIKRGLIADGVVDERDLWDVAPADLRDFAQVHLCAGIGVWSYALRSAGWSDDRPVWTGSFPCQPFSAAGKGKGFADERHLWPAGLHLIRECRPDIVFGEQVSSPDGLAWLDLVQADLEGEGYAVGAADTCSAGVGAPHIRQRLYWVAESGSERQSREQLRVQSGGSFEASVEVGWSRGDGGLADDDDAGLEGRRQPRRERAAERAAGAGGVAGGLAAADGWHAGAERQQRGGEQRQQSEDRGTGGVADANGRQRNRVAELRGVERDGQDTGRTEGSGGVATRRADRGMAHAADGGREPRTGDTRVRAADDGAGAAAEQLRSPRSSDRHGTPGPTNGLWQDADWLFCRDGKWRPVEPGTFPLANGSAARVGRLRGYGNAIDAEAAKVFIEAYLDTRTIEAGA